MVKWIFWNPTLFYLVNFESKRSDPHKEALCWTLENANLNDKPNYLRLNRRLLKLSDPFNKLTKVDCHVSWSDALNIFADTLFLVGEMTGKLWATGYVQIRGLKDLTCNTSIMANLGFL